MGKYIVGFIAFISIAGMGSILYDLIFGKTIYSHDTIMAMKKRSLYSKSKYSDEDTNW